MSHKVPRWLQILFEIVNKFINAYISCQLPGIIPNDIAIWVTVRYVATFSDLDATVKKHPTSLFNNLSK